MESPAPEPVWDGATVIATERLLLRTFLESDLPTLAEMNADPEVTRFLGHALTRAESDALLTEIQQYWPTDPIGMIAIERRTDRAVLGMAGLSVLPWYPDEIEVGWRLAREHWGHGYAVEAGAAWLDFAFTHQDLPRVVSFTDADPPNLRSLAVMHRLGMTFVEERIYADEVDGDFPGVLHAIAADDWRATQDGVRRDCDCAAQHRT